MKSYGILLATDDSAVEAVVRTLGTKSECDLKCVKTSREALSLVMDGSWSHDLAVVDLDLPEGSRTLLTTAGGALPVIAISKAPKLWLSLMLQHRRIGAALVKPVSPEKLRSAVLRVRSVAGIEAQRGNQRLGPMTAKPTPSHERPN